MAITFCRHQIMLAASDLTRMCLRINNLLLDNHFKKPALLKRMENAAWVKF
jgi:hypothetical protein